ncbi:hypothetical protein [Oceanicaulis sp.]|uniref:hypothetical protein n=1 Tax=Oceanicaulis sp. TaxID=1924941 RepID=UPI003D2D005A
MKLHIYAGMAFFAVLSLIGISGCAPLNSEGAECSGLLYRQCDITDGAYAGLATNMTYQEAFSAACRNIEEGRFAPQVVVVSAEGVPVFSRGPFCEQDVTVHQDEYWSFKQPGFMRDARVSARFHDGQIVEINVGYSGWDP